MPYLIKRRGSDDRSVSIEFDPPITMDCKRLLIGTRPMTADERAAIPNRLIVGKPERGRMPHILGWSLGPFIVSGRVRDVIEELEPRVHDFHPITLVYEDDKSELSTYYLILPPPQLDAVINEETEWWGGNIGHLSPVGRIALRASVVTGHHFWRGIPPTDSDYFCSDELRDRLVAEKLDGWDLRRKCVVDVDTGQHDATVRARK